MAQTFVQSLHKSLEEQGVVLVAVSKTKPISMIRDLYDQGIRDFGENRPQELMEKHSALPKDIRWHMIGNLQKNKVKYIAPFVHLIHSVSSMPLLKVINKEAAKNERTINVLLQVKIATEDTKSGLTQSDTVDLIKELNQDLYRNVQLRGFMGMASFTANQDQVREEFESLTGFCAEFSKEIQNLIADNSLLIKSMGMSGDYKTAIDAGSNMVRIGSLLFGARG